MRKVYKIVLDNTRRDREKYSLTFYVSLSYFSNHYVLINNIAMLYIILLKKKRRTLLDCCNNETDKKKKSVELYNVRIYLKS